MTPPKIAENSATPTSPPSTPNSPREAGMTAETLSAEERLWSAWNRAIDNMPCDTPAGVFDCLDEVKACIRLLATPELIALGEAAGEYGKKPVAECDSGYIKARTNLLMSARAYAVSVASIPT